MSQYTAYVAVGIQAESTQGTMQRRFVSSLDTKSFPKARKRSLCNFDRMFSAETPSDISLSDPERSDANAFEVSSSSHITPSAELRSSHLRSPQVLKTIMPASHDWQDNSRHRATIPSPKVSQVLLESDWRS